MSEVAKQASKKDILPHVKNLVLEICCSDSNGEDVEVPYIKYQFRWPDTIIIDYFVIVVV